MDNLINTDFPNAKTISPVAMNKPPVENVPEGNYLNRKLNFAKAPPHYKSKYPSFCTTLPPSPKDHLTHDPACTKCNKYPNRPFTRDQCYMLYSPQQNIWGPVCGDGGSNANWVRGNQFGVDYQYNKVFKRDNYAVDVPKFTKKNPVLVSDSPFYPFPDYGVRFNPEYKSYPYVNDYIKGKPTITFPYLTIENFDNMGNNTFYMILNLMIIFIVLFIIYRIFK